MTKRHFPRCGLFTAIICGLFLFAAAAPRAGAATLADWRLGEDTSGYVDPAAGYDTSFPGDPVAGAPFAPSLDSAGNPSRDMARMRSDTGTYNFRNFASYESFAGHTDNGFVGTASYHKPYLTQDSRGVFAGTEFNSDLLTSRNPDAFSNADLAGGFTFEVLWRPAIGQGQRLNFDTNGNVVMNNNAHAALASIEGRVEFGFRDADSVGPGVVPRIYFTMTGSAGTAIEVPLDLTLLKNQPDHFFSMVGVYEPSAAKQQRLYLDGVLVGSTSAFTLSNIDLNNGGGVDSRLSTIGGNLGGFNANAYFDAVRLSTGAIPNTEWLVALPEPSSLGLVAFGALVLCRGRRRS